MPAPENNNQYTAPVPPVEEYVLGYNNNIIIDTNVPLYDNTQVLERNMNNCKILADVSVLENYSNTPYEFSVIEAFVMRRSTGIPENNLFLRRLRTAPDGQKYYADEDKVVLMPSTKTALGEAETTALNLPSHVADTIWLTRSTETGSLFMTNMSEKVNVKTTIAEGSLKYVKEKQEIGSPLQVPENKHDYTLHADKVREDGKRPQIGKDRRIEGGEYTTAEFDPRTGNKKILGEIIVVDSTKSPEDLKIYNDLKAEVIKRAQKKRGIGVLAELLAINSVVRETMPYSMQGVEDMLKKVIPDGQGGIRNGGKINLDYFIAEGVGVCRHQALLATKIAETMIDNFELNGNVSIDRNELWNPMTDDKYGHAWMRYTDNLGEVYIVDPAQGYVGLLREAPKNGWNYMRDDDKRKHTGNSAGSTILANI